MNITYVNQKFRIIAKKYWVNWSIFNSIFVGLVVLERKTNSNTHRKYEFQQLTLVSPFGNFVLQGPMQIDTEIPQFSSDLVLKYGNSDTIALRSDINYTKNLPEDKHLTANVALTMSQWPTHGFNMKLNYNKTPDAVGAENFFSYLQRRTLLTIFRPFLLFFQSSKKELTFFEI